MTAPARPAGAPLVRGLAYLAVESADPSAWEGLATGVLGMAVAPAGDGVRIRLDDRLGRLLVQPGPEPGVAAVGWEVANRRALDDLAERLAAEGVPTKAFDDATAAARAVSAGFACQDPTGATVEVAYGALIDPIDRFVSPLGVRFVTGEQGLGHVTSLTDRYDEAVDFYHRVLGFEVRETVDAEFRITFLGCNTRQHAVALAQAPPGMPPGTRFDHLMVEVDDIDHVGRALDKVLAGAAPLSATLGRHWNDEMISFYLITPDGFRLEVGFGGKRVLPGDDVELSQRTPGGGSRWGHEMVAHG